MVLWCDVIVGRLSMVKTRTYRVTGLSKAKRAELGHYWSHLRSLRDQM